MKSKMDKISDQINNDRLWERHESLANFGLIKNLGERYAIFTHIFFIIFNDIIK